jgi:putative hemolysin
MVTPLFAASLWASEPTVALPLWLGLALIPLLICINGYFVAAEFAIVSLRRTRVEELVKEGRARAAALLAAIDSMDRSVAASQLGITLASLALGFVSEPAIARILEPLFAEAPAAWQGPFVHILSVGLTLSLITYLHVVFGEQMPKIAALQAPESIGLWIAAPINGFARMTMPLIRLMNGSSTLFLRAFGFRNTGDEGEVYSVNELRLLIEDTEEAGLIEPEAADYLRNVFALSNKKVRDIMVPREKVACLELGTPSDKVLEAVREGAHTRMPVYTQDINRVVGIVNTKDLFYLFSLQSVVILQDALYPAQFLDPNDPVSAALRLFRKSHRPMAIVRDETGAFLGILTLEDVLEEIVGDIEDEHDDQTMKARYARRLKRSGTTRVPGKGK